MRMIDADLQSANIGLHHSPLGKAKDHVLWRIINTPTLLRGECYEEHRSLNIVISTVKWLAGVMVNPLMHKVAKMVT